MASNQIEGSGQPGAPVQANVPQQVVYYMPHQQQQPPSYGQAIQQGYTPPQNVVITQQPQTVVVAQAEGTNQPPPQTQPQSRFPQDLYCSKCQRVQRTQVRFVTGMGTHIFAGVICCVGCLCGCCLIPYCVDESKDAEHYCSVCHNVIGRLPMMRWD